MAPRHILEMIDEDRVENGATRRADGGHCLGGGLFRHLHAEPLGDLDDEAHQGRSPLLQQSLPGDVFGGVGDRLSQGCPYREIARFRRIVLPGRSTQGENLEAGQLGIDRIDGDSYDWSINSLAPAE